MLCDHIVDTLTKKKMMRSYNELKSLKTFDERFEYLKLSGVIGESTFGYDRYLNQILYRSKKWKKVRDEIIIRDDGCDLGIDGFTIFGKIIVHHMNPVSLDDLESENEDIFNPNFLICTSFQTHNAIHYGDESFLEQNKITERSPGDTILW